MSEEQKNIIKISRKELSSEQIAKKENFESILSKHKELTKRPAYKQKKYYFILLLILVITYLIYQSDKEKQQKEKVKIEKIN